MEIMMMMMMWPFSTRLWTESVTFISCSKRKHCDTEQEFCRFLTLNMSKLLMFASEFISSLKKQHFCSVTRKLFFTDPNSKNNWRTSLTSKDTFLTRQTDPLRFSWSLDQGKVYTTVTRNHFFLFVLTKLHHWYLNTVVTQWWVFYKSSVSCLKFGRTLTKLVCG